MPRKDVQFNSSSAKVLDKETAYEVKEEAPSQRFQNEQSSGSAISASASTDVNNEAFKYKKTKAKGEPLKTSVISEVITGDKGFSGSAAQMATGLGRSGFKSLAYSGDAGTILGNPAGTPVVGTSDRANTRSGKLLDATNKKINYLASEQVLVEYDQPAPLSDQPDGIGYNGTPMNSTARGQKSYGSNPGDLLFDRSVDKISRQVGLFVSGQAIGEEGIEYGDYPTVTYSEKSDFTDQVDTNDYKSGNYMPDYIMVKFSADSKKAYLSEFTPHSIDLSLDKVSSDIANDASPNRIIDMNNAEIVRQSIDVKAGRETQPEWSPLARAVAQPTATVGYLHDLEAEMGAMVYASMRSFSKAHSYQLNKAAKDGQKVVSPIAEMFYKPFTGAFSSRAFEGLGSVAELLKNESLKTLPSADKFIGVFDSPTKYATKADVLTQPRSLKMHYSTARSNSAMFRLKPEFVRWMDRQDFFSTIEHEYDPLSPIYTTEAFKYVTRHNWDKQFAFTRNSLTGKRQYTSKAFAYRYTDRMSQYTVIMGNPLLSAIAYFLEQHAQKLYDIIGDAEFRIPVASYCEAFSLWDMLVMASTPYMQYERSQCFKDVLDYERNFDYPFKDLVQLSEVIDSPRMHYSFKDIAEPLVSKQIATEDVLTWILPDSIHCVGKATALGDAPAYMLPHYISEQSFIFEGEDNNNAAVINTGFKHTLKPVIRSGIRYSLVDMFYQFDDMKALLAYDPMVRTPFHMSVEDDGLVVTDTLPEAYVMKKSQNTAGHVIVCTDATPTLQMVMGVPRTLGWYFILPGALATTAGYVGAVGDNLEIAFETPDVHRGSVYSDTDDFGAKCSVVVTHSYVATAYSNDAVNAQPDALGSGTLAVGRGQNFAQQWFEYRAIPNYALAKYDGVNAYAAALSLNIYEAEPADNGNGINVPRKSSYVTNGSNTGTGGRQNVLTAFSGAFGSGAAAMWTRLQRLQFIKNPFAMSASTPGAPKDPYGIPEMLNMAGFMDLDYSVANNDRIYNIQEQGWLFTSDPWMAD